MSHKQRILNAYRGLPNDTIPVSPEFWVYYPAKLMKVPVSEYELTIPHWVGMSACAQYFNCEVWGISSPKFSLS